MYLKLKKCKAKYISRHPQLCQTLQLTLVKASPEPLLRLPAGQQSSDVAATVLATGQQATRMIGFGAYRVEGLACVVLQELRWGVK